MEERVRDRDRTEAEEEIMRATYRALCEHGFADLTMQAIADEYGKTTAAIHYHYDTKDDLLVAFLRYLLDLFAEHVEEVETSDPGERLELLLDRLLANHDGYSDFAVAMLEMRAQAPYNDAIREQFRRNDEYVRDFLEAVVEDGIESGAFDDVDPADVSRSLMTIVDGARTRFAVFDDPDVLVEARRTADEYLEATIGVEFEST